MPAETTEGVVIGATGTANTLTGAVSPIPGFTASDEETMNPPRELKVIGMLLATPATNLGLGGKIAVGSPVVMTAVPL